MCGEYYPGWFDSWGKQHHTGSTENVLNDLRYMLEHNASFSIYMVHGGTSFGFSAGANSPPFLPQCTSYDYDAPIDEMGRPTPKYQAIRELFANHLLPGESLPDIPSPNPVIAIPPVDLKESAGLFANLGPIHRVETPLPMEMFDQSTGCILYRTRLEAGSGGTLGIKEVHDIARIFVDGKRVGTVDRRFKKRVALAIAPFAKEVVLDILVEAMGRVNYGKDIHDRKGILGTVELVNGGTTREVKGWEVYPLPLDRNMLEGLKFSTERLTGPAFHRGVFKLTKTGDTFLDMRGWGKGNVWVNGHHLGRFWHIGPQQTLYLPGVWLKEGDNEVVALELEDNLERTIGGLTEPILNQLEKDESAPPMPVRPPGTLRLQAEDLAKQGSFADGPSAQEFTFTPLSCRSICLQSLSSQRNDPFASVGELYVLDAEHRPLPRDKWTVEFVDSEELEGEDGRAENVFDDDVETIWHSEWFARKPAHPHSLVIDLGDVRTVGGFRYVPRPTDSPGRIKEFKFYARLKPFEIIR
jgi:beta-galactosidase